MSARTVTLALHGKWHRRYGLACCPAHADRNPSLTLADGNEGRLLLSCKAGCSFEDVMRALCQMGVIGASGTRLGLPCPKVLARRDVERRIEDERIERRALAIWNEALPISGSLAERYLRARGITCELPDNLRFHPACWHPSARRIPAMIALVEGLPRTAIHRTFLRPDGRGKAEIAPVKAMLGACAGGPFG